MFETLEKRQMMSANLSGSEPGLLIIFGTTSSDTINVTRQSNGRIRVDDNGNVKTFASSAVNKIWAVAGAGHDRVTIASNIDLPATLQGDAGNDTLIGGGGNDWFLGGAGHDDIRGRDGNDYIYGEAGNDTLRGGNGNDNVFGGAGKDVLYGGAGRDLLDGGDNNDTLVSVGGGQLDTLRGGSGTDVFWADSESGESVTSTSSERSLGAVHRISKFMDLNIHHGFLNDDTHQVSRNLNGGDLVDPLSANAFQNFSDQPLFAAAGPAMTDVNQGFLGDCFFLATLAATAKTDPQFITRHTVDLGDGTYAVRFKNAFGEVYVRVDADLPVGDDENPLARAGFGADDSTWVAIWEKAYAFFRKNEGTYASIEGGISGEAFDALGIGNDFFMTGIDRKALMRSLKNQLANGKTITASTHYGAGSDGSPILPTHVYVIDRVIEHEGGNIFDVVLYNPHGQDSAGNDADPFDGFITVSSLQMMANFISFNAAAIS